MILLGFESTAATASVCLYIDGAVAAERICTEQRRHSDTLLPLADEILTEANLTPADVDYYCVDIGPGSFTGVRIGAASVNAAAHAAKKKVIGVDSLAVLWTASGRPKDALVVLDAGGGRAYAARYEAGVCVMPPCTGAHADFIAKAPEGTLLIENAQPQASALCIAAAARIAEAADAAFPIYLAPSQAERMFMERQGAKG